jgi:hypothetical protein
MWRGVDAELHTVASRGQDLDDSFPDTDLLASFA